MNVDRELRKMEKDLRPDVELEEKTINRMRNILSERNHRSIRRPAAAVLAALVLALGLGGIAYAAGWMPKWTEIYSGSFGTEQTQKDLIEEMGVPCASSMSRDGITVSAESVLNDGKIAAVLLKVTREDGGPLVQEEAREFEHLIFASGPVPEEDGAQIADRKDVLLNYFEPYTPGQTEAYLIICYSVPEGLKSMHLNMNSLEAWYPDHTETIATGFPNKEGDPVGWTVEVPLESVYEGRTLIGDDFSANGEEFETRYIHVSPLSVVACYEPAGSRPSNHVTFYTETGEEGELIEVEDHGLDVFTDGIELKVRLKDGTEMDLSARTDENGITVPMGQVIVDEEADRFRIVLGGVLDRIVPLEEIQTIIFAGKEYEFG